MARRVCRVSGWPTVAQAERGQGLRGTHGVTGSPGQRVTDADVWEWDSERGSHDAQTAGRRETAHGWANSVSGWPAVAQAERVAKAGGVLTLARPHLPR